MRSQTLAWGLIGAVLLGHILFLLWPGPLGLTGDEAYYWDWSRRLDYNYYSKPAMVALLIRASCAIFGDTALAVRLPAVLLASGSSALAWLLTRRLFRSERLALGVVGLMCAVPLLIAGSVLMTIDAPLFFLLALATTSAALALFEHRPRLFLLTGLALTLAELTKFSAPLWLIGFFLFLLVHREYRKWLKGPWPWFLIGCCILGLLPALIWNAQHGWVTFRHVQADVGGEGESHGGLLNIAGFFFGQLGLASPPIFALMLAACGLALRHGVNHPYVARMRYLLFISAPMWILPGIVSLWNKPQGNWTAPSYFGLTILAACFTALAFHDEQRWKQYGSIIWSAGIVGIVTITLTHQSHLVYYGANLVNRTLHTHLNPQRLDVARRARGWEELGQAIGRHLQEMSPDTMVMAGDYQGAALSAFYTPGQPVTYRFGAYLPKPDRLSQYEIWEDRRLDRPELLGKDAIIIASRPGIVLAGNFASIEPLETVRVEIAGLEVRSIYLFKGKGFKGMKLNPGSQN